MSYLVIAYFHRLWFSWDTYFRSYIYLASKKTPIIFLLVTPKDKLFFGYFCFINIKLSLVAGIAFVKARKNNWRGWKVAYRMPKWKISRVGNYDIMNIYITEVHIQVYFGHLSSFFYALARLHVKGTLTQIWKSSCML